MIPKVYYSLR